MLKFKFTLKMICQKNPSQNHFQGGKEKKKNQENQQKVMVQEDEKQFNKKLAKIIDFQSL